MRRARLIRLGAVVMLAATAASCAFYNTYYLARKYYMKATDGRPYEVDREGTTQRSNYTKAADYSKKVLGVYPKSKWVDDAWLMWARTLVGTDDPLKAVTMLEDFQTRFPKSELRPDAEFFLGLSYRAARKHELAVSSFDEFLAQAPRHQLVPYAFYERSKAFISLQRYREAAESASEVLKRFPGHSLADRALRQRAEARFQQGDWAGARADFHDMGARALTDEERLRFLLREVDCLESDRDYDAARALLRDARSHVLPPPPLPVSARVSPAAGTGPGTGAGAGAVTPPQPVTVVRTPAQEQYGKLTLRMGGVELLAGGLDEAVEYYRSVLQDYPRSQLAAEAQYRIGYAYETGADDFARARAEYARVREHAGTSQFVQQAQQRLDNLDRIDRFRTATGVDSMARKAEARFLVAEHYLYNLQRPERALDEYRAIADSNPAASVRARALNAQAWVLARKLDRKAAADSLFWKVVREYPATEAQLAARDYLETEGQSVPETLIVAPKERSRPLLDEASELTKPPGDSPRLGAKSEAGILAPDEVALGPGGAPPALRDPSAWRAPSPADSLRRAMALRDSLLRMARSDTSAAGRARVDSLRRALARPDTVGRAARMPEIARHVPGADSFVVAPGQGTAPRFLDDDSTRVSPPGARIPSVSPPPAPRAEGQPPARAISAADSARRVPRVDAGIAKPPSARADSLLSKPPLARADSLLPRPALAQADSVRSQPGALPGVPPTNAMRVQPAVPPADSPRAGVAAPQPDPTLAAEPVAKPVSRDIVEPRGLRLTRAQRDSVRQAKALRESLRRAEKARADSLKREKARAASLDRKAAGRPAGDARPDSVGGPQR